jgi:hypothetical protein
MAKELRERVHAELATLSERHEVGVTLLRGLMSKLDEYAYAIMQRRKLRQ